VSELRYFNFPTFQLVQVALYSNLHHLSAIIQKFCAVVGIPKALSDPVEKLTLDPLGVEMQSFCKDGSGHCAAPNQ